MANAKAITLYLGLEDVITDLKDIDPKTCSKLELSRQLGGVILLGESILKANKDVLTEDGQAEE